MRTAHSAELRSIFRGGSDETVQLAARLSGAEVTMRGQSARIETIPKQQRAQQRMGKA